jgi:hypothetical protein
VKNKYNTGAMEGQAKMQKLNSAGMKDEVCKPHNYSFQS